LTITRDSLSLFTGDSAKYFPIPSRIFTESEKQQLALLCQQRCFGARKISDTDHQVRVFEFEYDANIQDVINRAAILEQFVRLAIEHCSGTTRVWESLGRIFQNLSLTFGAAAYMSQRMAVTTRVCDLLFKTWDVPGAPGVIRCLEDSLNAELPSATQERVLRDILDGWGVVHLDESKHAVFHEHLAAALRKASGSGNGSKSTEYISMVVCHRERNETTGKLQFTVTRFNRRSFWSAMMSLLFSRWLSECAPNWAAIPPFARQFISALPRMFAPGLERLGMLRSSAWLHRLCLPFIDPILLPPVVVLDPKQTQSADTSRDRDAWFSLVFLATRYILLWHPESEQLSIESWLSTMLRLLQGQMPASFPPAIGPSKAKEFLKVLGDMRGIANALRGLFYSGPSACLIPALPILDDVSQRIGQALFRHGPDLSPLKPRRSPLLPSRPEHPAFGKSVQFEWIEAKQLRAMLVNSMRPHEWRNDWNDSAATHVCIRFPEGVSLLDLDYSLDWHYSQRMWLESDWRCFRLSDGSVAAIVPKQSFLDGCARNYLLQRLSSAATMDALDGHTRVQRLPLYPFVVQAFFSVNEDLHSAALHAIYAWLTNSPRRAIAVQFDQGVILGSDHIDFGFYRRLPHIVRGLYRSSQNETILELYRNSFRDEYCAFADDEKQSFHHLHRDAPCFVIGMTALIALGAEHYILPSHATTIIRELERFPEFNKALRQERSTAESRAYNVLMTARDWTGAPGAPAPFSSQYRPTVGMTPMSNGAPNALKPQTLVPLRWPKNDPDAKGVAHVAVYELLELPYLPVELRRLILFSISSGFHRETDVHALQGRVDVLLETWHNKQYGVQAQAQARTVAEDSEVKASDEAWRVMTELTRTLEYGAHRVHSLTSEDLEVVQGTRRMWLLRTDELAYVVDPRTTEAPSAMYNKQPVWRNQRAIIYHNPCSSRCTMIDEPRPLYSATDTFLEFAIIQSHDFHPRVNGEMMWAPAPLPIGIKNEDLQKEQQLSFPLDNMTFADWPQEKKHQPPPPSPQKNVATPSPSADSKALVPIQTTIRAIATTVAVPQPSPTNNNKRAKVLKPLWRFSPIPQLNGANGHGDGDEDEEM
jgi:hypothetical protein